MKFSGEKAGRLSRVARSSGAKPFLIVLLVLLFLIPVSMIKNLVGDGRTVLRENVRHLLCVPEQWKLSAAIEPEILTRGIFDVPVFECAVQSEGNFAGGINRESQFYFAGERKYDYRGN